MTQQTELDIAAIVARYLAVWNEPDAGSRRAAVAAIWLPDATEFVHEVQFRGHEELDARVTRAHEAFVASGKYTVAGVGDVTRHGDIAAFTAQLVTPDGQVDWASRVFLLLDADGRIRDDYQLTIKPLPA
jgi:ketosteroid isomerase-like protein